MKKTAFFFFLAAVLFYSNNILVCAYGEAASAEMSYKQIQGYSKNKDWGAVYDSYDKQSQDIIDTLVIWATAFPGVSQDEGYVKLTPRERFIKSCQQSDNSFAVNPSNQIVKTEDKGVNEVEVTLNNSLGKEQKAYMSLVEGAWKLHISEDSYEYKMGHAYQSGSQDEFTRIYDDLYKEAHTDKGINKIMENAVAEAGNDKNEQIFAVISKVRLIKNTDLTIDIRAKDKAKSIINSLLLEGADINARKKENNSSGDFILTFALKSFIFDEDLLGFLLEKGADINAKDSAGRTVLYWAVQDGNKQIIEFLVSKGAKMN